MMKTTKESTKRKPKRRSRLKLQKLWAKPYRLSALVTQEQDWHTEVPNVKLARVFGIVLILHIVAVGGILAFKMIDRTSNSTETEADVSVLNKPDSVFTPLPSTSGSATREEVKVIVDDPSHAGMKHYRVRSGDNLLEIARRMDVSVADFEQLNKLDSGNELYAGQVLLIPNHKISAMQPQEIQRLLRDPVPNEVLKATEAAGGVPAQAAGKVDEAMSMALTPAPVPAAAPTPTPSVPAKGGVQTYTV
ncbi:MAG: LysM peptidoglycan-binding domain-containing protein, partial [Verrucomicrobiales bacterium]